MPITSTPDLLAALKTAKPGDMLLLAGGDYATLALGGFNFPAPGVFIASADPAKPARPAGAEMRSSSGLTFRDLDLTVNPRMGSVFRADSCQRIYVEGGEIHDAADKGGGGVFFNGCTDVAVRRAFIHHTGTGVLSLNCTLVVVEGNKFRDVRGDGVQSSASSQVTLHANDFADFRTATGDHPDAIQFFTANQKDPAQDITITDNVIRRGGGDWIQGIFLGDEVGHGYVNVTITGNALEGTMFNGIIVANGRNAKITDNAVLGFEETVASGDGNSWIGATGDVLVTGNVATAYQNKALTPGNETIARIEPADRLTLDRWLAARRPAVIQPIVVEPQPPAAEPADLATLRAQVLALQGAGLAELAVAKARADTATAALAEIAAQATAGKKLTSAATLKPVLDKIIARAIAA